MYSTKALDCLCGHKFLQRWHSDHIYSHHYYYYGEHSHVDFFLFVWTKSVNPPEKILNKFIQLWHYS